MENLTGRDHLQELGTNRRIILKGVKQINVAQDRVQ
jgi:hypothetical protein